MDRTPMLYIMAWVKMMQIADNKKNYVICKMR